MEILKNRHQVDLTLKEIEHLNKWTEDFLKEMFSNKKIDIDHNVLHYDSEDDKFKLCIFYFPKKNSRYTDYVIKHFTPEYFYNEVIKNGEYEVFYD